MTNNRFAHLAVNDTLPKLIRHNARGHASDIAQREKELGLWKAHTWADVHTSVKLWGLGLHSLGVVAGDTVAIIGDSRPDWIAAAIGTHSVRARSLGLYQDALDAEINFLIRFAEAKVVVAENEEQVDKILRVAAGVSSIKAIIYNDPRGMRKYTDPRLIHSAQLFETARKYDADHPGAWDGLVDATLGRDIAVLCSTSGTTSNPKLVSIAGGPFIQHVANYCALIDLGPDDEYVSLLPMGWIGEQFMALFQPVVCRHKLNFVEDPATVMADLREIAPTFMFLAPRVWEQIAANVRAQMMDATKFKQRIFNAGFKLGIRAVDQGRTSGFAQKLVLRALRDRLGFSRLRVASTGGSALGPDTFKFFMAMGVPMIQLYGQTELGGIYCTQRIGDRDFDGVGRGLTDDYKIRIENPDPSGVGEIVSQHPYMFDGYFKSDEAANDLRDGWMHTGDAGYFKPSGQLVVIDRMKDLASTTGGERFSPQYIENKLKFSPYISEAVILGDGRAYPAAIICIRFAIVSKWAEQQRMAFTTYSDLAGRPEIYKLIAGEIARVNQSLPPAQQLRQFVLLYKELDADDGELTRTRKIMRSVIADKYATIIDAIYSGASTVKIDTEIAFQDGSKQRIRTTLPIAPLAVAPSGSVPGTKVGAQAGVQAGAEARAKAGVESA
jgi:long-chain acyl-CoA synthetase